MGVKYCYHKIKFNDDSIGSAWKNSKLATHTSTHLLWSDLNSRKQALDLGRLRQSPQMRDFGLSQILAPSSLETALTPTHLQQKEMNPLLMADELNLARQASIFAN